MAGHLPTDFRLLLRVNAEVSGSSGSHDSWYIQYDTYNGKVEYRPKGRDYVNWDSLRQSFISTVP